MSDAGSESGEKEEIPIVGVYEGERNAQKERHGKGKNTFPNGDTYEGVYANGKRNGEGVYKWKGTYLYASGGKKSGAWVNGLLNGPGEIVHADHKIVGVFKNDYEMEMPVELIFPKSGYTKTVGDPNLLGLVPKPVTAE
ncbi:Radial spoke head 1 [Terramyces sp. JEL0728]|nr:Radial spoke head 1 [Terramyces sp. JEL0728]